MTATLALIAIAALALLWATYSTVAEDGPGAGYKGRSATEDVVAMTCIGTAMGTALAATLVQGDDLPNLLLAATVAAATLGLAVHCSRRLHTERAARVQLTLNECGDRVHTERRVAADKNVATKWHAAEDTYGMHPTLRRLLMALPTSWAPTIGRCRFALTKLRILWYVARQDSCTMQDVYTDVGCDDLTMYAACHELVMEGKLDGRSIYEGCISNHTEVGLAYNI
jgi:hypothetical protein